MPRSSSSSDAKKQGGGMQPSLLFAEDFAVSGRIFSPCLHPGMTVAETRLFTVVGVVGSRRPLLLRTITWGTERRFKRRTRPELFAASCSYRRLDRPPVNSCFSATFLCTLGAAHGFGSPVRASGWGVKDCVRATRLYLYRR